MNVLIFYCLAAVGINIAMFIPAYVFKTDRFTDISYALSFVILASLALWRSEQTVLQLILFLAICLWAFRLGGFLLFRIWKIKRDKRFDGMRENFFRFLGFWLLQGLSVFIISVSSILVFSQPSTTLNLLSVVGLGIFFLGLWLEATADIQKYRFNQLPKNKGKWIETGVWSKSRHPNYLGEMMVWVGIYLLGVSSLNLPFAILALISPLYIIVLLMFVSGVPILEKSADAKWGKDAAYQQYKKSVPLLLPKLLK